MNNRRQKIFLSGFVLVGMCLALCAVSLFAQTPEKRLLTADDIYRGQEISDPQVSPEGRWIAYTVAWMDREADKLRSAVWMIDWEGKQNLQVTFGPDTDTAPRWSPDGKYLAFLSARPAEGKTQVWLLDRRGGEARPLTSVKGYLSAYEWSPDGKRLVLVMSAGDEESGEAPDSKIRAPKPIVIDRYFFKKDYVGYLTASSRDHLYLFDVESRKLEALTGEKKFDESEPSWSPDGSQLAFVSNRADDPDRTGTSDILIVEARAGAAPRKLLTVYTPDRQKLVWSPDGRTLAFVQGFEPKFNAYNQERLAVVPVAGGEPLVLTASLDRGVMQAEFTPDGSALTFLVEDDQRVYLAKVPVAGGTIERVSEGGAVLSEISSGGGHTAVAAATDASATEIYALESGKLRKLTAQNDALFAELRLGAVEDMSFRSKDGAEIHGLMVKPPFYEEGKKYPTLLWIHGGPNMQDDHSLTFGLYPLQLERQFFAANGYVVLAINYRGGSGFGAEFQKSIFADWGNKEVADLLAGVDEAVRQGVADPDRLGLGGWSYGGILTNYTVATDGRFKAAVSGAGSSNQTAMYGVDQYVLQYDNELGPPSRHPETWMKVSYPFFHADRIHTPMLFLGGEKDCNVPIIGGEQMYQALKTLGVPTQLVVYPGQYHLLTRPSYIYERLGRYLAWFDGYLKPPKK
jgi:dipeptidyl aminopeptidase/acylaminoacyl peptidase